MIRFKFDDIKNGSLGSGLIIIAIVNHVATVDDTPQNRLICEHYGGQEIKEAGQQDEGAQRKKRTSKKITEVDENAN